jgi:hypothetical protein
VYAGAALRSFAFTRRMPVIFSLLFSPWNAGAAMGAHNAVARKFRRFTLISPALNVSEIV